MTNVAEGLEDVVHEEEAKEEMKEITITCRLEWTREQSTDPDDVSAFVAKQLHKMPPVTSDHVVVTRLLKNITSLKAGLAEQADLLYAFNLLDHCGDGKIKNDDFRVAIKALGYTPTKEELQHMVHGVDKGRTGKMSFENFSTAIMRKVMAKDSDMDIMKSFRLFDNDDRGLINFANLKRVSDILGANLTDEEIEEMLDDADKDVDGYVNFEEFQRTIKNVVHILTP